MEELDIENSDLYELLEIDISSTTNDIKKAYRKKALQCHPDKNPDDPNAAKKFQQLLKVLEVLTDEAARLAYDKILKGRKEAKLRTVQLDGKRRKLKEDLEERERKATERSVNERSAHELLKEEIERLRKEGSKQVEEEVNYVLNKLKEEQECGKTKNWDGSKHRIKINWSVDKNSNTNGGYTYEMLHTFLSKYGEIQVLVMSPKKRGSALVEFKEKNAAEMAIDFEIGLSSNPLKLQWVDPHSKTTPSKSTLIKDSDFESLTLTKMRQAEERKRLIAQMMAEDEET